MAAKLDPDKLGSRIKMEKKENNPHLLALLYEACVLNGKFDHLKEEFVVDETRKRYIMCIEYT